MKRKNSILLASILLLAAIFGICGALKVPKGIENYAADLLYRRLDGIQENIKIIAIDDESLTALGPYSDWNRGYFAKLIELLNAQEGQSPAVIGIDVIFSGTNDSPEDQALADVASKYDNIVLASLLETTRELKRDGGSYDVQSVVTSESKAYEALASVTRSGFTNVITDEDGVLRRVYTTLSPEYQSFAYVITSMLSELPEYRAKEELPKYHAKEEIRYSGKPGETEVLSMARVLDGTVPASYFADSIVLVGAYAEGMLDAYQVPCDRSRLMYGVEVQANTISALLHGKTVKTDMPVVSFVAVFLLLSVYAFFLHRGGVKRNLFCLGFFLIAYPMAAYGCFVLLSYKLPLLSVFLGLFALLIGNLLYQYMELLKKRQRETQVMLFSMAEAFAEAIEGRTPYNANHTKNVAKRCVEMLDYINGLHKEGKTELHFSKNDRDQLYLAAMLHDVGKMDVPLEVMDKPTKLGSKEERLKDKLNILLLKYQNDILTGKKERQFAEEEIKKIERFLQNLGAFNCGRPLKDEEWAVIEAMEKGCYEGEDGTTIPYLSEEEKADLRIERGTLSDRERKIMQSHVEYTDKILSRMTFGNAFHKVRRMASDHHELLNGKGYPKGISEKDLDVMTRILTIMDIYDSLIADDRPYKKPKSVEAAFEILDEEAQAGKVDGELLKFAKDLYLKTKD